jgi:hypothetical protein
MHWGQTLSKVRLMRPVKVKVVCSKACPTDRKGVFCPWAMVKLRLTYAYAT